MALDRKMQNLIRIALKGLLFFLKYLENRLAARVLPPDRGL